MASFFVSRAMGVFVVGDSNSPIYHNLLLTTPRRPETTFVFNVQYIPEFWLSGLAVDGRLDQRLYDALVQGLVILPTHGLVPVSRTDTLAEGDREYVRAIKPAGQASNDETVLVFNVGHRDFARALVQLGPGIDFELPDVRHGPSSIEVVGSSVSVPLALVDELIAPSLRAFSEAMRILTNAGFRRLYFVAFRPPTLDDDEFERRWQLRSRAHLRYKLALLMNDRFADACERLSVEFVDSWPLLTKNGVFDESYELDHVHINRDGAVRIAKTIVDRYVASVSPAVATETRTLEN